MVCGHCGAEAIAGEYCPECGRPFKTSRSSMEDIAAAVPGAAPDRAVTVSNYDSLYLLILVVALLGLTIYAVWGTWGSGFGVTLLALGWLVAIPSWVFWNHTSLTMRVLGAKVISPEAGTTEKQLYDMVANVSRRAGLHTVPSVGILDSPEMNAMAFGRDREHACVVFTTSIVEHMDPQALGAVAAHEVAHIAYGDQVGKAMVLSAIYTYLLPLLLILLLVVGLASRSTGTILDTLMEYIGKVYVWFVVTLSHLPVLWFSRWREFNADRLGASLTSRDAMILALQTLSKDDGDAPRFAWAVDAFRIKGKRSVFHWAVFDLFKSHPNMVRRIRALQKLPS